ncbi:TPA: hypothetical protein DEP06_03240 [Candidatus Daviesbacteria bacterium]|nr:hypothetical protein [Candidatus Daviesbacteria bacterium]
MTLTQTAILTKKFILFSTIALVLGITGFIGYSIWQNWYLSTLPIVEEQPDTKFGVLPALGFPQRPVSSSNFTYSLDTTTGGLPKFDKIIKVFFLPKTYATFLSSQKSQELAEKFNIKTAPQILSEINYLYKEGEKTLEVNLDSGNFLFKKEATPSAKTLDSDDKLMADFKSVLSSLGVLKDQLKNGRAKVTGPQISIWPEDLDGKTIFTPEFNKSLVNAEVSGSADNTENYLALNFTFFSIDDSTFATYPLRKAEESFEDLKQGKGVIMIEPPKPQVSITSVYLGYYLPESYTPYLQPIYVFEGPQFVAFASAVSREFQTSGN